MNSYDRLIDGYRAFRAKYLARDFDAWRDFAASAQDPRVMIAGCSDSRVNPAILTHAGLGEIFAVNNVANIIPAFERGRHAHRSAGAALQYAVTVLNVRHIIVMGHSGCGGIRALMNGAGKPEALAADDYIAGWLNEMEPARAAVEAGMADAPFEDKCRVCEMEAALRSAGNLMTYPFIAKAYQAGRLSIHAWYFQIETGGLFVYDHQRGAYRPLVADQAD